MRKPGFCLCENKDADQLRGNCEAVQRHRFRYVDSTIPLLSKSEISSLQPSSVVVQPGLCQSRSETRMLVFSQRGSFMSRINFMLGSVEIGKSFIASEPDHEMVTRERSLIIRKSSYFAIKFNMLRERLN